MRMTAPLALLLLVAPAAASEPLLPPPVKLESRAGTQTGTQSSYCVQRADPATGHGLATCADSILRHPLRLSVVRPGETIAIAVADATRFRSDRCGPAPCLSSVTIKRLGCARTVLRLRLDRRRLPLYVSLPRGGYELQVRLFFETADGRSGDSLAFLGFVVDGRRPLGIVKPRASDWACRPAP
jgi:hypothetical protein